MEGEELETLKRVSSFDDISHTTAANEYAKWCKRMDDLGNIAAFYDCDKEAKKVGHRIYYYFVLACTFYACVGWSLATILAFMDRSVPCIISTYEIRSDGKPKNIFGAFGTVILTLIPPINCLFRPDHFKQTLL